MQPNHIWYKAAFKSASFCWLTAFLYWLISIDLVIHSLDPCDCVHFELCLCSCSDKREDEKEGWQVSVSSPLHAGWWCLPAMISRQISEPEAKWESLLWGLEPQVRALQWLLLWLLFPWHFISFSILCIRLTGAAQTAFQTPGVGTGVQKLESFCMTQAHLEKCFRFLFFPSWTDPEPDFVDP